MSQVNLKLHCWLSQDVNADANAYEENLVRISEGETLLAMIRRLSGKSEFFKKEIFNEKTQMVREELIVLLNDRLVNIYESTEAILKDGDVVVILPIIYGG